MEGWGQFWVLLVATMCTIHNVNSVWFTSTIPSDYCAVFHCHTKVYKRRKGKTQRVDHIILKLQGIVQDTRVVGKKCAAAFKALSAV